MGKYTAAVSDHLIVPARVHQPHGQERLFRLAGRPVPVPLPVRLIIDTGSKRSCLVADVQRHLQLESTHQVRVETGVGSREANLFWVRLEFPDTALAPIPHLAVVRLTFPPSLRSFHGLIGRDLLHQWESFHFEGRRGRLTVRDVPGGLFGWLRR
jgi:hypothetical protein